MPSRASLADRKNISLVVVISYEESNSQIWSRHSIFLLSMHNGIFDGNLTAGAIGVNPIASFQTLLRVHLSLFSNPHSYCVLSDPIHWVTEPAPLDEGRNVSIFTENLRYSGSITSSTIFWAFITIHNSSPSHYHINLVSHEPTCSLQKSFASVVKTSFSYFNKSGHRCPVVLIVPKFWLFWAFMTIHNSSQGHYHIIWLVTNQHFVLF